MFRALSAGIFGIALWNYGLGAEAWALGPSFDCAKAQTWAEQSICRDAELAALDVRLARVFERLREALGGEERSDLILYQRGFLKGRGICQSDKRAITGQECLKRIYRDRLAELHGDLASIPVPAAVAQKRPADCYASASSWAEVTPCLERELDRVDAELNTVADDMRVQMRELDKTTGAGLGAEQSFTAAQEAFFQFRRASCEWRAAAMADGTGANDVFLSCMVGLARTRTAEIQNVVLDRTSGKP